MKFFRPTTPDLPLDLVADVLATQYGLEGGLTSYVSERDQNIRVVSGEAAYLFKVCTADEDEEVVDLQIQALRHVERVDSAVPIPRALPTLSGTDFGHVTSGNGTRHVVRLLSYLDGEVADRPEYDTPEFRRDTGAKLAGLDRALRGFFHSAARQDHPWDLMRVPRLLEHVDHIADESTRRKVIAILERARDETIPACVGLRHQVIHQDAHTSNLVLDPVRPTEVTGIIDFGDLVYAPLIVELAISAYLSERPDPSPHALVEIAVGFDGVTPLEEAEVDVLYDLVLARMAMSATIVAARQALFPSEYSSETDQDLVSQRIGRAVKAAPDVTDQLRRVLGFSRRSASLATAQLHARRVAFLGEHSPYFYKVPLHVVAAKGMWIEGADGKRYLDFYNNVPTVGHNHPQVVNAVSRQLGTLNTNTRYLYSVVVDYAERLTATLGHDLDVCLFVNSGSEANDVASQILKQRSETDRLLVIKGSYHGMTEAALAITGEDDSTAPNVTTIDIDRPTESLPDSLAGFFVDPALTSNGIPTIPPGVFASISREVRQRGGLVVADEVQAGFGRTGVMWGHEQQGFVPDIVTMGKPAGNGQPLGVVVTRREILDDFLKHTGLFSTFGGNPVSSAAGLAVLDVIDREGLVENSADVGAYLKDSLRELAHSQELIGAVRGNGLMVALELVTGGEKKTPAIAETAQLIELMREAGVLVGAAGMTRSVLKLRPPLIASREDVDLLVKALDSSLSRLRTTA